MLEASDQQGSNTSCPSTLAPVHKLLIAAGEVSDKGNAGDGAYIIAQNYKIQKDMKSACEPAMRKQSGKDTFKVCQERGVYNMNVQAQHGALTYRHGTYLRATAEPRCVEAPPLLREGEP